MFGDELLLPDHLTRCDYLGHDDEQIPGDDVVHRARAVSGAEQEIRGPDDTQAEDDCQHAEPLSGLEEPAKKSSRQQAGEDYDSSY